jgi:hypothetical protein
MNRCKFRGMIALLAVSCGEIANEGALSLDGDWQSFISPMTSDGGSSPPSAKRKRDDVENERGSKNDRVAELLTLDYTNELTSSEQMILVQKISAPGSSWGAIVKDLPGHTEADIQSYWNSSAMRASVILRAESESQIRIRCMRHDDDGALDLSSAPLPSLSLLDWVMLLSSHALNTTRAVPEDIVAYLQRTPLYMGRGFEQREGDPECRSH